MQPVQKENADSDFPPCTGCIFQKPLHQLSIYNGVPLSCLFEEGALANAGYPWKPLRLLSLVSLQKRDFEYQSKKRQTLKQKKFCYLSERIYL